MIVRKIKQESPKTKLYLQSVLPVNDCYGMFNGHTSVSYTHLDVYKRQTLSYTKNRPVWFTIVILMCKKEKV